MQRLRYRYSERSIFIRSPIKKFIAKRTANANARLHFVQMCLRNRPLNSVMGPPKIFFRYHIMENIILSIFLFYNAFQIISPFLDVNDQNYGFQAP